MNTQTLKKGLVTLALVGTFTLASLIGNCLRERTHPQESAKVHQTLQMKTGYNDSAFYGGYRGSFEDYYKEFYCKQ